MEEKNDSKIQAAETVSSLDPTVSHGQPVHPAATWPDEPQDLTPTFMEKLALGVWDGVLILMPMALLAKAIIVGLSGIFSGSTMRNENSGWQAIDILLKFNGQMITVFTIVFITIMSSLVKRYALWKAERGATLAELEHLQGSVSWVSTLRMTLVLRSFRVQSLALLFVWCFYYVGSQAAKEELKQYGSDSFQNMKDMLIQRPDGPSIFNRGVEKKLAVLNSSVISVNLRSLLAETSVGFGSIFLSADSKKVSAYNVGSWSVYQSPSVDTTNLDGDYTGFLSAGWHKTRTDTWEQPASYQDLPLFQYDSVFSTANVTAILGKYTARNVSYFWLDCEYGWTQLPVSSFPNVTYHNATIDVKLSPLNETMPTDLHGNKLRQIVFWYRGLNSGGVLQAQRSVCNLSARYFDMDVECTSTSCLPKRVQLAGGQDQAHATSFDTPFSDEAFLSSFWGNLSTALGYQDDYLEPNMAIRHLIPSPYGNAGLTFTRTNIFNTYYRLSQISLSSHHRPQISTSSWTGNDFLQRVAVYGAVARPQTRVSWPWLAMDIICALILLTAASACAWFRARTVAPDMLGYVSSLTRNNPDLVLPSEASTLSGLERARMLKHVKVKIGAITGPDGVARIGLTTVDAEAQQLKKGMKYS